MRECIICRKEILGTERVNLDETHHAHLQCFYGLVPAVGSTTYVTAEEDNLRTNKIEQLATELIKKYDAEKNRGY